MIWILDMENTLRQSIHEKREPDTFEDEPHQRQCNKSHDHDLS